MKNTVFTGAGVALVTPMNDDLSINYTKLEELIEMQIAGGTDAIITCGTTGESATMSHAEHADVIKFTVECVKGRIPVVAGTGSNETAFAADLSMEAERLGADALLLVTPYYIKTSQRGLIAQYNYVADRVNIPMILYNVPSRTGCNIKPETYLELSKHKNIVATKEANGDISSVAKTMELCGDNLQVYSGNDDQIVPIMSLGGKGVISVLSNVAPRAAHDIPTLCLAGDYASASKLQLEYLQLINDLFIDVNPIPVKEALNIMGYKVGPCRMPLYEMDDASKQKLTASLKKHGLC